MGALCCKGKRKKQGKKKGGGDQEDEHLNDDHSDDEGSKQGGLLGWITGENDDDEKKEGSEAGDHKGKKKKKDNALQLKVTIKSAKGLKDSDWIGSSDPYAVIEIPSRRGKGKKKRVATTEICGESENPVWNQSFIIDCKLGDPLDILIFDEDTFSDELLGKAIVDHSMYYPFGYDGEVRLNETGSQDWAFVKVQVEILRAPKSEEEKEAERQGPLHGLNFEENKAAWKKAHDVVNAMEGDEALAREETTSTALETLVRLAETGLPIPHEALSRVVACLQSTDRRYRLASLMICKALGRRVKDFATDIAEALLDDDEDVRSGACKVLGTLGDAAAPAVTELGHLLQDEVPAVRSAALEALGLLSQTDCLQALVVLGTCLDHQDKRYRLACALILKALGVKATPHAYSLAERIEQDESVDVKVAACGALGNLGLGAASVQPALVSLYHAELDGNIRVQQAAQQALQKLKDEHRPLPAKPDQMHHEPMDQHKAELHDMLNNLNSGMKDMFKKDEEEQAAGQAASSSAGPDSPDAARKKRGSVGSTAIGRGQRLSMGSRTVAGAGSPTRAGGAKQGKRMSTSSRPS